MSEADIGLVGERVDRVVGEAEAFVEQMKADEKEHVNNPLYQSYKPLHNYEQLIQERIEKLRAALENTKQLSEGRRAKLAEAHRFWQIMANIGEEDLWISEKMQQLTVPSGGSPSGGDEELAGLEKSREGAYLPKPDIVETEMKAHKALQFDKVVEEAKQLIDANQYGSSDLVSYVASLEQRWAELAELVRQKQQKLSDLQETKQFFLDAEDVDSYLYELSRMLTQSAQDDLYVGKDEINVVNLLKKHKDLEDEFNNYKQQITEVHDKAAKLPLLKRLEQRDESQILDEAERKRLPILLEQVQSRLNSLDRRYEYYEYTIFDTLRQNNLKVFAIFEISHNHTKQKPLYYMA